MNKLELLTVNLSDIMMEKGMKLGMPMEDIIQRITRIDFPALYCAISEKMQNVYHFLSDGDAYNSIRYRGSRLFGQNAVRLFRSKMLDFEGTNLQNEHWLELWVLDDMTPAFVSCFRTMYGNEDYITEYREYKGTEWPVCNAEVRLEAIVSSIQELCPPFFNPNETIVFET